MHHVTKTTTPRTNTVVEMDTNASPIQSLPDTRLRYVIKSSTARWKNTSIASSKCTRCTHAHELRSTGPPRQPHTVMDWNGSVANVQYSFLMLDCSVSEFW